jgi:hypothetical protein
VRTLVATGAGFLLAVLWFDLMFDVQARHHRGDLPADVRRSISGYYARVTTAARPMNRLVALAMLVTIGALVAELVREDLQPWRAGVSLALTVSAVGIAGARTVPNAVRLGRDEDDAGEQSRLARSILRDHVTCFVLVAAVLALQLAPA